MSGGGTWSQIISLTVVTENTINLFTLKLITLLRWCEAEAQTVGLGRDTGREQK